MEPALGYSVEPALSPDGTKVAYIQYRDPPAGAARDGGPIGRSGWRMRQRARRARSGPRHRAWAAAITAPGSTICGGARRRAALPWERSGFLHVYAIDAATNAAEPRELTPGKFEVETFVLGADDMVTFSANADEADRRHFWQVPARGGVAQRVTEGKGSESLPVLAGGLLAGIAADARHPAHPVLAKGLAPLGETAELKGAIAPEAVTYTAEDGVTVHGQLFRGQGREVRARR